jgi:Coenzyme PQQ synthesis protein D (PqqD)
MDESQESDLIALTPRLRYRAVGNEGVLVHLDTARVIVVNQVGLHIVQSLQQPMTRRALVEQIVSEFQVGVPEAERDLEYYLQELAAQEMLATASGRSGN